MILVYSMVYTYLYTYFYIHTSMHTFIQNISTLFSIVCTRYARGAADVIDALRHLRATHEHAALRGAELTWCNSGSSDSQTSQTDCGLFKASVCVTAGQKCLFKARYFRFSVVRSEPESAPGAGVTPGGAKNTENIQFGLFTSA